MDIFLQPLLVGGSINAMVQCGKSYEYIDHLAKWFSLVRVYSKETIRDICKDSVARV